MRLITDAQRAKLIENYAAEDWTRLTPVVKLFTPDAAATWVLATLDPEDGDTAWGLCDLGLGFPELGYVSLSEIASIRGKLGLPVERDEFVHIDMSMGAYAEKADVDGCSAL